MKHDLIFLFCGPAIGSAVCFFVLMPLISFLAGDGLMNLFNISMFVSYVLTLPIALVIGVLPGGLACILNAKLIKHQTRHRRAWCVSFGFLLGFIPLAPAFFSHFIHGPYLLAFGLVGAIPAGVCSWLADQPSSQSKSGAGHNASK